MPPHLTTIARRLRSEQTKAEEELWTALRSRRLDGWKFRRQVPIKAFVVDFVCMDARLTVELDGRHHYDQPEKDANRRAVIEGEGFLELRFTNDDVRGRLDWVVQEIRRTLEIARAQAPSAPFARMD